MDSPLSSKPEPEPHIPPSVTGPDSNWGRCHNGICHYYGSRCIFQFCRLCCIEKHQGGDFVHEPPAIPTTPAPAVLVCTNAAHVFGCMCRNGEQPNFKKYCPLTDHTMECQCHRGEPPKLKAAAVPVLGTIELDTLDSFFQEK